MSNLVTTKEVCEKLNISQNTANRWRRKGMPYIQRGNVIRYELEKVLEWLKNEK